MTFMSTRFDYAIYVEMDWYAVGRHILTRIIRSTTSNDFYVDTFWLGLYGRNELICSRSTRFDYVIYVDMKNFGNYKMQISKLGTYYSFASDSQGSNFVNIVL